MKISLILATRNRAPRLTDLLNSIIETCSDISKIEIVIRMDSDDIQSPLVVKQFQSKLNIIPCISKRIPHLGQCYNEACALSSGEIIVFISDDNVFKSKDWDIIAEKEICKFADKIVLLFGKDGSLYGNGPTHFFIHRNWINVLGYFEPEKFIHFCGDVWLQDIAKRIDRYVFTPEIFVDHLHYVFGQASIDSVYSDAAPHMLNDNALNDSPESVNERIQDANKLLEFIRNYKENNDEK